MQDETPNEGPRQDISPAQPVDGSPSSASEQPPVPGAEESTPDGSEYKDPAPVGQAQTESAQSADVSQETPAQEETVADDDGEPGDDRLDPELEQHVTDRPDQPDQPDQEG